MKLIKKFYLEKIYLDYLSKVTDFMDTSKMTINVHILFLIKRIKQVARYWKLNKQLYTHYEIGGYYMITW